MRPENGNRADWILSIIILIVSFAPLFGVVIYQMMH